jgi:hypothetical protein
MTELIEERLRLAADQAMAGVELTPPDDADDTGADADVEAGSAPQRRRWWITATAGLAAAAVLAVIVWAAALREPAPTEPVQPPADASPQVRARAAVESTLAAPQWRAEISGGVTPFALWFHEPDRYESINGIEPTNPDEDDPMRAVQIGRDLYVTDDGGWTRTTMPERDLGSSHRSLLGGLLADGPCFADVGELIVVWQDPETGCGSSTTALPGDLPPGSDLWVVRIDDAGRLGELAVGEIPGAVGSERQELDPTRKSMPAFGDLAQIIQGAGGQSALTYEFDYDDVPPITAPAE